MIYLNFNNLDAETQEHLLQKAREHVESENGKALKTYCKKYGTDYQTLLEEESIKILYSYDYVFNI